MGLIRSHFGSTTVAMFGPYLFGSLVGYCVPLFVVFVFCHPCASPCARTQPLAAVQKMDVDGGSGAVADEQLAALLAIIGREEAPQQALRVRRPSVALGADLRGLPDDLLAVVRVAQAGREPAKRVFEQRSEALMDYARYNLAAKKSRVQLAAEKNMREVAESKLRLVAAYFPLVSKSLGIKREFLANSLAMASIHIKLAVTPRVAGAVNQHFGQKQDRSSSLVAGMLLSKQARFVSDLFSRTVPREGDRVSPASMSVADKIGCMCLQWDETSQRLRAINKRLAPGVRASNFNSSAQVMVFSGSVHLMSRAGGFSGKWDFTEQHPFFNRSLRLAGQDTDFILEGLTRLWPLDILDVEVCGQLDRDHVAFIVTLACDRAAPNFAAIRYICGEIADMPHHRILVHTEPCGLHGMAIVKSRSPPLKRMGAAFYSFTRWLRVYGNVDGLTVAIHHLLEGHVEVRDEQRPPHMKRHALALIESLFGPLDAPFLWTFDKRRGIKVKTQFHLDLLSLADTLEFCTPGDDGSFVFYNRVSADSDAHLVRGLAVGAKIFETSQECSDQVVAVVLNFFTGRGWLDATESRHNKTCRGGARGFPVRSSRPNTCRQANHTPFGPTRTSAAWEVNRRVVSPRIDGPS
jgi:hypothetical protein